MEDISVFCMKTMMVPSYNPNELDFKHLRAMGSPQPCDPDCAELIPLHEPSHAHPVLTSSGPFQLIASLPVSIRIWVKDNGVVSMPWYCRGRDGGNCEQGGDNDAGSAAVLQHYRGQSVPQVWHQFTS